MTTKTEKPKSFATKTEKTENLNVPLYKEVRFEELKIQPRRSSKAVRSI